MDAPLSAKLAIPRRSRTLVHRARVNELLARALDVRLVLVSAPPGFGKTTATVDWLATTGIRIAWISLDESDNDPVRLHRSLDAGVASLSGGAARPDPQPSGIFDPLEVADDLAERLTARPEASVLVLDDYHLISAPVGQRLVGLLLERLPPHAHLVIVTRADPMLPLARLRARGELLELRADALRFTSEEAGAFLTERMGLALSDGEVATLMKRTEGWPAVLLLAGLSLAQRGDVSSGVREFGASHRFVLDYVVEEILARLSADTVDFLLLTSVLERLCGPLCDAVADRTGSQAQLEELDRANLMIIPLDDERRWYRYHALFADVLRARLLASHPAEDIALLHRRASAWHEAEGNDREAIGHALRSGDSERTSRLVSGASLARLNAGELSTLRQWLDALPPEAVREDAQLSASYAWCLTLAGETSGVSDRLADAERALASGGDVGGFGPLIPAQLALLRSRLASLEGDAGTAIAQASLARSLVPPDLPPGMEATLRGDATVLLAVALARTGDHDGARTAYLESLPDLRSSGNTFALGRAIADLAALEIARGDAGGALRLCEAELERGPASAGTSPAVWAALARARAELGQAELADTAARKALDLAFHAGDTPSARSAEATLARVAPLLEASSIDSGVRSQADADRPIEALSVRELEVLRLVALGRSNSEIAAELYVTVGTVKAHVHNLSGKVGARNRTEAVALARQLGLLA